MKKVILFIFLFQSIYFSFSQFNIQTQKPKTPEAYLFEKYGDFKISEYQGRNSIQLPIYNITYGDIQIPLNLSYTSNGIRVDEEASEIGLGWTFPTGMVSQIVLGKDDIFTSNQINLPDYYSTPYPQYLLWPYPSYYEDNNYPSPPDAFDSMRYLINPATPDVEDYSMVRVQSEGYYSTNSGLFFPYNENGNTQVLGSNIFNYGDFYYELDKDTERDIFIANFFGHNIQFYLISSYQTGTDFIRVGKTINEEKYRIELITPLQQNTYPISHKVEITSPDGIKYVFEEELVTGYESHGWQDFSFTESITEYDNFIELSSENLPFDSQNINYFSNSKIWKITKIIDTKDNEIVFEYEALPQIKHKSATSGEYSFTGVINQHFTPNPALTQVSIRFDFPLGDSSSDGRDFLNNISRTTIHEEKSILKRVLFSNVELEMNLSSRQDIPHDKHIESIDIIDNNNIVESINLYQSYFNANHLDNKQKRLRLDSLTIGEKKYKFDYESDSLPDKNSLSFDYWGYYNGFQNQSKILNPFRILDELNQIPSNQTIRDSIPTIDGLVNRSAHPSNIKAGILTKITYPTGGYSEFEYGLNQFDNIYFPNYDNKLNYNSASGDFDIDYQQTSSQGNGLRIEEITNYTKQGSFSNKRSYTYTGGKHINPYVFYNTDDYRCVTYTHPQKRTTTSQKLTIYYSNIYQNDLLGNGNGVGYDEVVIEDIDSLGTSKGYTKLFFSNEPDVAAKQKFGQGGTAPSSFYDKFGYSIKNTDVENGNILKREIYDKNENLLIKEENTYQSIVPFSNSIFKNQATYNVKAVRLGVTGGYAQTFESPLNRYIEYMFYYYPLKKTKTLLATTDITEYFYSNPLERRIKYTYNNNYLPLVKETTNFSETISYSKEEYNYMVAQWLNIFNWNSQTRIYNNNVLHKRTIYDYTNQYNGKPRIESIKNYNNIEASNQNLETSEIIYDNYDDIGNLIEFHKKDGNSNSIIWGYNKRYPIAWIENSDYSSIASALGVPASSLESLNESNLSQINSLRALLPNSMVTTYTYDPSVGVTSITDPRGNVVFYEYDDFNRLKHVKDKDDNILSKNEYNYRTQN